jgi:predicted nuclease of predicted toxin-antitoxin system
MRFKVDENLPEDVAALLNESGHDAVTVLIENLGGSTDAKISAVCKQEERILITLDTDFADIRSYPPDQHSGLIVLRLKRQDKIHVIQAIKRLVEAAFPEPVEGRLWIVEENRIRIRE